ncbi:hypothetical protein DU508_21520 [Pedobacter chinensis]|uniref:Uncharacterized protein n=1 Tax=Pedobacter chinensis TaxID=2282421 RepID=A0A369PUB1_9SPHI|nr:hypothetical protein DU508_21520 [Pedobacter chinensis]
MFLPVVIISIYVFGIISMFCMDSLYKALSFFAMLLVATFVLFLFINYPLQSAISVICMMALFAFKLKD